MMKIISYQRSAIRKDRMRLKPSAAVVRGFALLALGGCSLGHGAPAPQHFILGGEGAAASASSPSRPGLAAMSVGLRRLQVASYLGSPFIVVRRGDQEVTLSEFNRWGEPLAAGIGRAVAGYLKGAAPFVAVDVAPWPAGTEHDYLIELNILRFEGVAPADRSGSGGEVHILAEWQILRPGDRAVITRGTSEFRQGGWEVGDHAALVDLLNAGLRSLAEDLVTSLATVRDGESARVDFTPSQP